MSRGYHLIPKITIEEILKNTSIEVIAKKDEGNDRYFLQDNDKNICWVNMSTEYSKEQNMNSVEVGVLDFHGSNREWFILSELVEKAGVMFYNDSMISERLYVGGCLKKGDVVEFMRMVLGSSIIDDDFIHEEESEEIIAVFEIEEHTNYPFEEDNIENDYDIKTDIDTDKQDCTIEENEDEDKLMS
jgi:hypothetical protein